MSTGEFTTVVGDGSVTVEVMDDVELKEVLVEGTLVAE